MWAGVDTRPVIKWQVTTRCNRLPLFDNWIIQHFVCGLQNYHFSFLWTSDTQKLKPTYSTACTVLLFMNLPSDYFLIPFRNLSYHFWRIKLLWSASCFQPSLRYICLFSPAVVKEEFEGASVGSRWWGRCNVHNKLFRVLHTYRLVGAEYWMPLWG